MLVVVALLFVVGGALAVASGGRIVVARDVTVAGEVVRLGDVASLEGDGARALAGVALGGAPSAGESRVIDGAFLLGLLKREGGGLEGITYTIPAAVRVRRATQEVPEAAVRQALEEFLGEALGVGAADALVRSVELSGPIRIPVGTYRIRIVPPPGASLVGRVRLQAEIAVDGRPVKSVWLVADLGMFAGVVVARRPIARGETLAADDVSLERRDLSETPRGVLTSIVEASGAVARAPITPFAPIRRDQVETAAAVHRGDVVLLVAERGALRITAPGEAREDAGVGEQVHVLNRGSHKDVVGRVVDASTVAVDF